MSLANLVTGGADEQARRDLENVLNEIKGVHTPTKEELQLGPLAQFYNAGNLTPAQMEAAQAGPSAFNNENLSSVPMSTMQEVLARDREIAGANGMTPQMKAQLAQAEDAMNRSVAGQRGAIEQSFAGMGVPQSLISAALQNGTAGQEAQQGYLNAVDAAGAAADRGQNANNQAGALASTMYGQQAGQANAVAAAQDALNAFNASNVQQSNMVNAGNKQAANVYNASNAQDVSNKNVGGQNSRLYQNQVEAPQQSTSLALAKTGQEAQAGGALAGQQMEEGKQNAALIGGLIGAGSNIIKVAEGGEIPDPLTPPSDFMAGGAVPGQAMVQGDDERNDTVPARLSPGEFVVPREQMQRPEIRAFLAQNVPTPRPPAAHPSDISSVLRALAELRGMQ